MVLVLACGGLWAEDPPKAEKKAATPKAKKDEVAELLKDTTKMEGFITLHKKGAEFLYAEIPKSSMNKPFLMSYSMAGGVAQNSVVSGMMGDENIYYWKLADKRLFLVKKNVRHLAEKDGPIAKAVAEDFADSIVAMLTVKAKSGTTVYVDLADFLFTDYPMVARGLKRTLGLEYSLDKKRTMWGSVKTFAENVEIEVAATYSGSKFTDLRTVPDSRAVSIINHFSFSSIPKSDYKPRPADDRIGFFLTAQKDYSLPGTEIPFVRYVNRWKLEKADPDADVSPPKKPIVFYIEKSVPYEYRPIVREALVEWNKAFEKAGFINAIEVRYQEDDAEWDAEDVRYNTIRWVTGELGYAIGPSRTNPLTGEIYDADILVDSNWMRSFQKQYEYLVSEVTPPEADTLQAYIQQLNGEQAAPHAPNDGHDMYRCEFAAGLGEQLALAAVAEELSDEEPNKKGLPQEFLRQGLKELIMHEVGHTLGLRHNFKASATISLENLNDKEYAEKNGLSGSVMDYNLVNIAPEDTEQGYFFTPTLGAWDYLTIEYGYKQLAAKPGPELTEALNKIAERAAQPELAYATDGDIWLDMDPYVNQRDMTDDALAFSKQRTAVMTGLWGSLLEKLTEPGQGYQRARAAFLYTLRDIQKSQYFASRLVGGVVFNRNHRGDTDEQPIFKPIPAARQREALAFINEAVLADGAYDIDPKLLAKLAPNRWDHWGSTTPSKLGLGMHDRILAGQLRIVNRLFSPKVLARIQESPLYTDDTDRLTIAEVYQSTSTAIWSELQKDTASQEWTPANPFISSYRRNLQRTFLKYVLLNHTLNPSSRLPQDARSVAWATLHQLQGELTKVLDNGQDAKLDALSNAHLRESKARIAKALEAAFSVVNY